MLVPLFVLAVGALLAGMVFKEYFVGHVRGLFWGTSLLPFAGEPHRRRVSTMCPAWVVWSPFVAMVLGFAPPGCSTSARPTCRAAGRAASALYQFLLNKWYFDELYDLIFVRPAKWLGRFFWKKGDGRSSMASVPTASLPACSTPPTVS
jgi:NADH-quinone oxidoreductase subunit L